MTWRPIDQYDADKHGLCLFAIRFVNRSTEEELPWEYYALYQYEDGDMVEADGTYFSTCGLEDFEWFAEIGEPPAKPLTVFEAAERLGEPLGMTGPEFLAKAEGESE